MSFSNSKNEKWNHSNKNENLNTDVNELVEKMTTLNVDNDGSSLANFNPISYPEMVMPPKNSILPPEYNNNNNNRRSQESSNFGADNSTKFVNGLGVFNEVYTSKPSYVSSPLIIGKDESIDVKTMDRLSYIVHLLEEQQNERTNNVLEEYVLYILLGTFVIFIVDSFSRGGKYIR